MKKVKLQLTPLATAELCILVLLIPIALLYIKGTWARRALKLNFAQALYAFDGDQLESCLNYLTLAQEKGDPFYPYIHQVRGKISADVKENWAQAEQDYRYLEGIPGSEALATLGIGIMEINRSRDKNGKPTLKGLKDAKQLFRSATTQEPNFLDAKIYLAALEVVEENYDRGLNELKALEKKATEPDTIPSIDGLTALYFFKGIASDAKGDYEQAVVNFKKCWQYRKLWPKNFAPVPYINYERSLAKQLLREDLSPEENDRWLHQALNYIDVENPAYYMTLNGYHSKDPRLDLRLGTYSLYMAVVTCLDARANLKVKEGKLEEASNDISIVFKYLQDIPRKFGEFEYPHQFSRITSNWTRLRYSQDGNTVVDVFKGTYESCEKISNRDKFRTTDEEYYKLMLNWGTVAGERFGVTRGIAEEKLRMAIELFPLEQAAYKNMEILYRNTAHQAWNRGQFNIYDEWTIKADEYKAKMQGTSNSFSDKINTYRESKPEYYIPLQEEFNKKVKIR